MKRPSEVYKDITKEDLQYHLAWHKLKPIAFRRPKAGELTLNSLVSCDEQQEWTITYDWEGEHMDPRLILERVE